MAGLVRVLTNWCLHQSGVIRMEKTVHSLDRDSILPPEYYIVMEESWFSVTISKMATCGGGVPSKRNVGKFQETKTTPASQSS